MADIEIDLASDGVAPTAKKARLNDERVAALPTGSNLIERDGKCCTHEVAWPPGVQGSLQPPPASSKPPARTYPFTIDPFQETAIRSLEAGHSVLVAAHTSAGKTVVAEYAFAMALRDKTRVIYTSPLKALSNQKYRELYEEFKDVGLMTGDVTINPDASCLVMTTEILRSMLYRGSEVVREVQLLVYDEIHYLRDKERGVVWEESIIMAPKSCRFAFLSATIPNALEFASWVAKTHGSPCHVVYTDYRPTPLQHFIFPTGSDSLLMVVDERGVFREDNFQKAVAVVHDAGADGGKKKLADKSANKSGEGDKSDIFRIVKMIIERNFDPVIVFAFSKKECERLVLSMSALDLTDETEKQLISSIFKSAMECLSLDDQKLPQVNNILPMLKRGIGLHHSGLLPIMKEVIEILFQEGLLKVLFATETFSTGLNMPAKTVVFTNARKFDGGGFRWVTSGEYIQMSGRAGRRGLDDKGVVILMLDAKMESSIAKEMIKGAPDHMHSEFHLGYNMLLNLASQEDRDAEQLMASSFRQFQVERSLPQLEARLALLRGQYDSLLVPDEAAVASYMNLLERHCEISSELRSVLSAPQYIIPFLQPGRLIRVLTEPHHTGHPLPSFALLSDGDIEAAGAAFGQKNVGGFVAVANGGVWGCVVAFQRQGKKETGDDSKNGSSTRFLVDVLVNAPSESALLTSMVERSGITHKVLNLFPPRSKRGVPQVVSIPLDLVDCLSSIRVYIQKDLRPLDARLAAINCVGEAVTRLTEKQGKVPVLDPKDDLKIDEKSSLKLWNKLQTIESQISEWRPSDDSQGLREGLAALQKKKALADQVASSEKELKAAHGLVMKEDLKHMLRVLRRLNYLNEQGIVTIKGRVAAAINSGHDLVLVELMFNGSFADMSTEHVLAACSCFVCQEKMDPSQKVPDELKSVLASVQEAARRVAKTSIECRMEINEEEYVDGFRPTMMEVVVSWYRGMKFSELIKITSIFEGAIVRSIRRLEELLRQLQEATKAIGDETMAAKFELARDKIKRDVIFANSLYL